MSSVSAQLALSYLSVTAHQKTGSKYTGTIQEANTFFKGTVCGLDIPQVPNGTALLLYVPITGLRDVASGLLEKMTGKKKGRN